MRKTVLIIGGLCLITAAASAQDRPGMKTIDAPKIQQIQSGAEVPSNLGSFDQSMVGQDVYNRQGDIVGRVKAVDQGRLIVALGSSLGLGTRDVGMTRAQVAQAGAGKELRLTTDLSRDELAALPAVGREMQRGGTRYDPPAVRPDGTRPVR